MGAPYSMCTWRLRVDACGAGSSSNSLSLISTAHTPAHMLRKTGVHVLEKKFACFSISVLGGGNTSRTYVCSLLRKLHARRQ